MKDLHPPEPNAKRVVEFDAAKNGWKVTYPDDGSGHFMPLELAPLRTSIHIVGNDTERFPPRYRRKND